MPHYLVTWVIDEEEDSAIEAARSAWIHRNSPDSTANVFYVQEVYSDGKKGRRKKIDLQDFENPKERETTSKYVPYGINGEYFVYDNEAGHIPMGYGSKGGTKKSILALCKKLNLIEG